jgi:5-bromo-4-chloroindolyl phosphate hydrolysis protein
MFKWFFEYRTRKQLIEKGLVDKNVKYLQFNKMEHFAPSSLKWGLVFLFVGASIILLRVVAAYVPDEVVLGTMLVAAGLGLLVYYVIADAARRKFQRENGQNSERNNLNP